MKLNLLLSLSLNRESSDLYSEQHNKAGDAGVDLPFVSDWQPYDTEVPESALISFKTVFAMYRLPFEVSYDRLEDNFADYATKMDLAGNIWDDLISCIKLGEPVPFSIRPRSSIWKSPFRLANSIGTIDYQYKGCDEDGKWDELAVPVDYMPSLGKRGSSPEISTGQRLFQIVSPMLEPIVHVNLKAFDHDDLYLWAVFIDTSNGRGGFGSTGA
jgi:dUTPase